MFIDVFVVLGKLQGDERSLAVLCDGVEDPADRTIKKVGNSDGRIK